VSQPKLTYKKITRDIRLKTLYLKRLRNSITNQLNVDGLTWKKNINYTKGFKTKKMTFNIIGIKIKIPNKFYSWLNGEIEKKNKLNQKTENN
jgi:hypothetical protein